MLNSKYSLASLGALLIIIGLGIGWVNFQNTFSGAKLAQAVGTVITTSPSLMVSFQTASGTSITFTSSIIDSSLHVGQNVAVVYNPQFPDSTALIKSDLPQWMTWLIPLGFLLLGCLGLYLGARRLSSIGVVSNIPL